ncbi:hypothetical protein ES703_111972 [subsurface metagenome]
MTTYLNGVPVLVAPADHAASHEDTGGDEVDVAALSGLLGDDQHVLDAEVLAVAAALLHASRHIPGGADPMRWTADKLLKGAGAGADPAEIDVPGLATKEFWIPAVPGLNAVWTYGPFGNYPYVRLDTATEEANANFAVPADFNSVTSLYAVLIPVGSGSIDWTQRTSFATSEEAFDTHTDIAAADGLETINQQMLWIDVSAALTGLASLDVVGLNFNIDVFTTTTHCYFLGWRFKYT